MKKTQQLYEQNENLTAKLVNMGANSLQSQGQMTKSSPISSTGSGARSIPKTATSEASHAIAEKILSRHHQNAAIDNHQKMGVFAMTPAYSADGQPLEPVNSFGICDHHHSIGLQVQGGIESQLLPQPDSFDFDFDELLELEQSDLSSLSWQGWQPD